MDRRQEQTYRFRCADTETIPGSAGFLSANGNAVQVSGSGIWDLVRIDNCLFTFL